MSQALEQKYRALQNNDRFIVQLFSLLYSAVSRSTALQCLNVARQAGNLHTLTTTQFADQVRKLINSGLLISVDGSGVICPTDLREIVARHALQEGTFKSIVNAIQSGHSFQSNSYLTRDLRLYIYQQNARKINKLLSLQPSLMPVFKSTLVDVFNNPFDLAWLEEFSLDMQEAAMQATLEESIWQGDPADSFFDLLEQWFNQGTRNENIDLMYVEQLWLRGRLTEAIQIFNSVPQRPPSDRTIAFLGTVAFLENRVEESLVFFRKAISLGAKTNKAKIEWFSKYPTTLMYFFAALKVGSAAALKEAQRYAELIYLSVNWLSPAMAPLLGVLAQRQGTQNLTPQTDFLCKENYAGVPALLEMYCLYWLSIPKLGTRISPHLLRCFRNASRAGYDWIAVEVAELLIHLDGKEDFRPIVESLRDSKCCPLMQTLERKEPWELSLQALKELAGGVSTEPRTSTSRIIWRIEVHSERQWKIAPLEQKSSTKGWTKGKPIALKHLMGNSSSDVLSLLTDQDRKVCQCIVEQREISYGYRMGKVYHEFSADAIVALVGHPHVYWEESSNVRVEIVKGEPELTVTTAGPQTLHLQLLPDLTHAEDYLLIKETPTRLKVIEVKDSYRRIAALLGINNCLTVPVAAKERVLETIASLSTLVTVHSDIGGGVAAEEVPADPTPRLHLLPAGEGLRVSILVHPFAEGGAYYPPGQGGATVLAEVEGKRLQAQRNLREEKKQAQAIVAASPMLQKYSPQDGEWHIDAPEDCLELLLELQTLGDQVQLEWPQGEKFKLSRVLSMVDFKFQLGAQQDWFAASGEVRISEDQVLDLRQLMALLDGMPGKFIKLSEGQFVALTDEFRKRLQTLNRLVEKTPKGLRLHNLAALSVEDVLGGDLEQLRVDKAWTQHIKRIKAAQSIEPQVPKTLQATLRDYQIDGYRWLARLAHWGVGACLADDMGLGKTIQVLTLILHRAQGGPTLVIAPTSVGMNWISESDRFAPSLNVKTFTSGDRQKLLDEIGPQDLLVCSYGLLQQDDVAEKLAQVQWHTIVLDEAQAIKNANTKRAQAAMALTGSFKVITTGTPIENHLGELWSLFRFINPGLLGSLDSFNRRFGYPIERDQDGVARDALRRLIQPFILRRTKNQVLQELPSRTEITLQVELSSEEMAFYEALRRESLEKLANSDVNAGAKHLQVLAEIMRLRRACCNPRLVRPELSLPSAKLEQFGEVLEELLDNGHKALVFSQFVDHLTIIRDYLDEKKVTYQYLDGSTPVKQRKQQVDAFQNGEGDVFLISLKAGGSGLNLTAADYVIHMDPWWNPAVEDQASDRAHRIGQQRPVTIYRLVAQGTIEDKIVALHQTKRDLADSLLEGADLSGKISTEDLLALLSQT